jgi:hypothetical protein
MKDDLKKEWEIDQAEKPESLRAVRSLTSVLRIRIFYMRILIRILPFILMRIRIRILASK